MRIVSKKNLFYFILICFQFVSCSKDNQLNENYILKEKLLGVWEYKAKSSSYTFYSNNVFIDSLYGNYDGIKTVYQIIRGNYEINNGYIKFDNVNLLYNSKNTDMSVYNEYYYYYPQMKIQITNDELKLTLTKFLYPIQNNYKNSILGKWSTSMIMLIYSYDLTPKYFRGEQISELEFFDNNMFNLQSTYKYEDKEWSTKNSFNYTYNSSKLVLIPGGNSNVSFENNKMIWDQSENIYYRIK